MVFHKSGWCTEVWNHSVQCERKCRENKKKLIARGAKRKLEGEKVRSLKCVQKCTKIKKNCTNQVDLKKKSLKNHDKTSEFSSLLWIV